MRAVTRYSAIFLPSISISNSATRAHFMPRTVLAASATAFSAALAKLCLAEPTISMTFWPWLPPLIEPKYIASQGRTQKPKRTRWMADEYVHRRPDEAGWLLECGKGEEQRPVRLD